MSDDRPALRIGEVSRRTGVGVPTLRAWERRYGLLDPERTHGGHRLYSEADVARVQAMQRLIDEGWTASVAATEAAQRAAPVTPLYVINGGQDAVTDLIERLDGALSAFDAAAVDTAIDDTFARFEVVRALDEVVLPVVRQAGEGWRDDARVIAREHFATNVLRPRLQRLLRGPVRSSSRRCIALAPEGEEHDLGLLAAAVVAVDVGWRVHYLGARTPVDALTDAVAALDPDAVLVGALHRDHAVAFLDELTLPLGRAGIVLGGAGFRPEDGDRVGGIVHDGAISGVGQALERALQRRHAAT